MREHLLERAREQAERADSSVRAAALLRIARAESTADNARARQTLLEALDAVEKLTGAARNHLLNEARGVAAAVSPELLAAIPVAQHVGPRRFASDHIVQTMLAHGHLDAAFEYLTNGDDPESFPFLSVGGVLYKLDPRDPECAIRRLTLLRRAFEMWRKDTSAHHHEREHFARLFGRFWKELSPAEALAFARTIADRAANEPDTRISSRYEDEIHFSSRCQDTMFRILHVLRHLDPALAQALVSSHDQLAAAARRYPNGLETILEEAELRKPAGATCESKGYLVVRGDSDRQRWVIDAARNGDFETLMKDALDKYHEDTSPESRNYAPKEYWPSTGAFRAMFYQAGTRLGAEAAGLLERIPDADLRLFATIELAAALAGVPESSITTMKHPHAPDSRRRLGSPR